MNFFQTLPDGWTIYLWLVMGGLIILAVIFWIYWGSQNEQFDEDIKYVIFDKDDQDKMAPEEFAKSQEVMKSQMASREKHLARMAEEKARKHEKR
jgi:cbb3-type cytochrome oxidase subunit 3